MKEKEKNLLEYMISHPFCDTKEVLNVFSLKDRQFTYLLAKVNASLKEKGYQPIKRTHQGTFEMDETIMFTYDHAKQVNAYEDKKYQVIILLKLISAEYTSLHDISWLCSLSKNTVLKELHCLKEMLLKHGLQIIYSRAQGYELIGDEESIRTILFQSIENIIELEDGIGWLNTITNLSKAESDILYYQVSRLEKTLEREFLDVQIRKIVYLVSFVQMRNRKGFSLQEPSPYEQQIRGTKEFQAVMKTFSFLSDYSLAEQMYITTIILSAKVVFLKPEEHSTIMEAIENVCQNFENICQIQLQEKDRERFKISLFQHWLPTQYHIQFHFHVENPLHEYIVEKYKYLYICTKEITKPLEKLLHQQIPPSELSLLTILFGGWLKKYEILDSKIRLTAIVVCPSGISISNLVFFNLKELFPEIHFITYCSVRQFKTLDDAYDVVFSTVSLKTKKRVFLIKPDFHEDYKRQLRRTVMNALFQKDASPIQLTALMQIIEGYAQIENRNQLEKKLHAYLYPTDEKKEKFVLDAQEPGLLQLLVPSHVKFHDANIHWKEAIWMASKPLLEDETIEKRYVERMILIIEEEQPFIEIGKEIMIAHASIEDGVLQPCISLLQLEQPIVVSNYFKASTIFVLATTDYQIHLKALNELFEIIKDEDKQRKLENATTYQDIIALIGHTSSKK